MSTLIKAWLYVKRHYLLYRLYSVVSKRKNSTFPSVSTNLFVTGYQRSGNTFAWYIVRDIFPKIDLVTHLHLTCSLARAKKLKVPTIILLRDPLQAISSSIYKTRESGDTRRIKEKMQIMEYVEYYTYVYKNRKFFTSIVYFEEMIKSPSILVTEAQNLIPSLQETTFTQQDIETAEKRYKSKKTDASISEGDKGLPSEVKQKNKNRIIQRLKDTQEMKMAEDLYMKLRFSDKELQNLKPRG